MLRNFIVMAIRNMLKRKTFSVINITSLALGLATGILIIVFVLDEMSFDRFHSKGDRIYRVVTKLQNTNTNEEFKWQTNGRPVGMMLAGEFPEVESMIYLRPASHLMVTQGGSHFQENLFFAGEDFFNIFSFNLKKGDPKTALQQPFSIVLTEDLEKKYFGDKDAIGQGLILQDSVQFVVTGIMEDVPARSHLQFGALLSFSSYPRLEPYFTYDGGWSNFNVWNYILLRKDANTENFIRKAANLYLENEGSVFKSQGVTPYLQFEPLRDIYLKSEFGNGTGPIGSIKRIYEISGIALFLILLACINYINLSTAQSVYRAKEVGLRKVVGSSRALLVKQFLSESLLVTLTALVLAVLLIGLFLPFFNEITGKAYTIAQITQPSIVLGGVGLALVITFISGYYPALSLSMFQPAQVLKGQLLSSPKGVWLRRALVVFQFTTSISLVIGSIVVVDQLDFMQSENLGFSKEKVLVVNASRASSHAPRAMEVFKNEIKSLAHVEKVSIANAMPGRSGWQGQIAYSRYLQKDERVNVEYLGVDEDYIETLGLKLIAGRNFDPGRESDMKDGLIINEKAAALFKFGSPDQAIGETISEDPNEIRGYPSGTVIGVVADYHQFGLQREIGPMVFDINPQENFLIRFNGSPESMIAELDKLWQKRFSGYEFQYFFLDADFERQYQSEQRLAKVFEVFSAVTIFIAIIGLLGLISFAANSRLKEIGIRKILGASPASIAQLLSREFLIIVVVATLIAAPVVWFLGNEWLRGFAYRTTIKSNIFIFAFLGATGLTLLVICSRTLRAARSNPIDTLRNE